MAPSRILPALAILILAMPVLAGAQRSYTENFTTTTYQDVGSTTAHWNTTAGELALYPFPQLIGNYDTAGLANDVVVDGDLAFVADRGAGLQIIDISDPAAPTLLGTYDTPGLAFAVAVSGDLAFVADWTGGLAIIDVSDPTTPTLVATSFAVGGAEAVRVDGNHVFVADYSAGLIILDITNPATPTVVGSYTTPGNSYGVAVDGNYAFVADWTFGLHVIDISDVTNPTLAGTYDTPGSAYGVAVDGDYAFVADLTAGLQVIDISDLTNPTLLGTYDTSGNAYRVVIDGDFAYVADYAAGLQIIDISNPATPLLAGTFDTPGDAWGVAVAGELAFIADYGSGLQVIRVASAVKAPSIVGAYDTPGNTADAALSGNLAFLADANPAELNILDITNPAAPGLLGNYPLPLNPLDVEIAGNLAFVADSDSGLVILDITTPAGVTFVGSWGSMIDVRQVIVTGDVAVINAWDSLRIVDVSDPTGPTQVASYPVPSGIQDVAVSGNRAFVIARLDNLAILDISDPTNPLLLGSYPLTFWVNDVAVSGDLTVLAGDYAARFLDISDPASPTLIGTYDTSPFTPLRAIVVGDLAVIVEPGIKEVLDISDPTTPTLVSTWLTQGASASTSITVAGDFAFLSNDYGLTVVQVLQHEVDSANNIGQSLAFDGADDTIARARLSSTATSGVSWELSADGGANWQAVPSDNTWNLFTASGNDLLWRSTLEWSLGTIPTVSDVTVEWLNEYALITSITDIPNDQGKQVSVEWTRSGHDFVGDPTQIVEYAVYRKIDPTLAMQAPETLETFGNLDPATREHALMMQAAGWHFLVTVPVRVENSYAVVVPTLADSNITAGQYQSTFMVTAFTATPGVYFDSPPDSGYSVDNLAPGVPQAFSVAYNTGSGNTLAWDDAPEPDFQYYRIYRSSDPNFTPAPGNLVHETATAGWADPDYDGGAVYYKVTALDFSGNESDPASAGTMTAVPSSPAVPEVFALHQNYPNPFNPTTLIRYDVPRGGAEVTLRIYDVSGRLVRTLVDGLQPEGQQHATWDGRDGAGRRVSTGTYFYRLTAPGFEQTRKMVLLK